MGQEAGSVVQTNEMRWVLLLALPSYISTSACYIHVKTQRARVDFIKFGLNIYGHNSFYLVDFRTILKFHYCQLVSTLCKMDRLLS